MSDEETPLGEEITAPVEAEEQPKAEAVEQDPPKEEPKPEENDKVQKRFDELTRKRYEAERRAEEAERRYQELIDRGEITESDEERLERLASERAKQMLAQREQQAKINEWDAKGRQAYPDFVEKCNTLAQMGANRRPDFVEALMDLDDSPHIVAALADDPAKVAEILSLPPHRMGAALARVKVKIPDAKPVSKAPRPPTPVDGAVRPTTDPNEMSVAEQLEHIRRSRS